VQRVQAIILNLADIEDSLIAVRQTRRHAGAQTSYLVAFSKCMNGPYGDEPSCPQTRPAHPVLRTDRIERSRPENDGECWDIESAFRRAHHSATANE
jgi:hypothetical protein